jgi:hypothetical protein
MLQIDIEYLRMQQMTLEDQIHILDRQINSVYQIRNTLGMRLPQRKLLQQLSEAAAQIELERRKLQKMADVLEKVLYVYGRTENKIIDQAERSVRVSFRVFAGVHFLENLNPFLEGITIHE